MEIFLDDFAIFGNEENHVDSLQKCFDKCMEFGISINVAKSIFLVPFGRLLGHIVSEQGIATDPNKIASIVSIPIIVTEVKGFFWIHWLLSKVHLSICNNCNAYNITP